MLRPSAEAAMSHLLWVSAFHGFHAWFGCGVEPLIACRASAVGRSGAQGRSRTCNAPGLSRRCLPFHHLSTERALSESARSTLGFEFSKDEAPKSRVGRDPGVEPGRRENEAVLTGPSPDLDCRND